MNKRQVLRDYTVLTEGVGVYNYISERDEDWKKVAKEDDWLGTLEEIAERYDIKVDKKDTDEKAVIYHLEDFLSDYLGRLLLE